MSKRLLESTTNSQVDQDDKPPTKKVRRESTPTHGQFIASASRIATVEIKQQQDASLLQLHLLSCGYIKKHFTSRNINPCDIAQIIVKFLYQDWKFDYCYDFLNKGSTIHCIENNGKTLKCNGLHCGCFFSAFLFAMKPQSGKHKIKFKINQIEQCWGNVIGIVSDHCKQINSNNTQTHKFSLWYHFRDYIGWSSHGDHDKDSTLLPNGLLCGIGDMIMSRPNNIFHKNNFDYCSNNENYKTRLPGWKENNVVVLEYDSDLSILSFSKENDNGKLDSCIKNLPKGETFYWFVGHYSGKMHLTIV